MDLTPIYDFFGTAFSQDVTKWTCAFCIAAWVHSGQVKREMKKQFGFVVDSIDNLSVALRNDMNAQANRISSVENGVNKIIDRVDRLEKGVSSCKSEPVVN